MYRFTGGKVKVTLWTIAAFYTLLFWWLACRKFDVCAYNQGDTAAVNYMYWSSLHGKFFWHFDLQGSTFEMHQEPLILLFWPIYFLFPGVKTLFLITSLCITLAGVAAFLVARKVLEDDLSGCFAGLAYLFYPSIVSQHINQLHTSVFPVPFLMFAFYFYFVERFRWFVVFLVLACLGKENVALTAFMFFPLALVQRRHWKWIVTPAITAFGSLILSFGIIRPMFASGRGYIAMENFSHLGNSMGEVLKTVLTQPGKVISAMLTEQNFQYLLFAVQATGWVFPWFAAELMLILPDLLTNTISHNTGLKVLAWHYNLHIGSFLVIAAIISIPRIERLLGKWLGAGRYRIVLSAALFAFALSSWWMWFNPREYLVRPAHDALHRAFKLVPKDASLLVGPSQIMAHLSEREVFSTPDRLVLVPEEMYKYNWVLFDMNFTTGSPFIPADQHVPADVFHSFRTNSLYEMVFAEKNVFVFRRRESFPPDQVRRVRIRGKTTEKW
ncbi:MAG: DUF2079 domain-containing protein [Verrucomicrobiae bacterium]|nr:DUF2079 domain-containing protein [Verrucomicrobiae bacterium]